MKKKTGYFFLKFFIRATIGMALIFIINKYVLPAESSINVGLNPEPLEFLGFVFFIALHGINFCKFFTKTLYF